MSGIRSLALAATLWLVPLTAMAQHSGGTLIPVPTMAEPDGANSLIHNSAGLATLRSWELRVYNTQLSETSGQGTAVLFATPVFGPLFLGVAAEHVRPPSLDSQFRLSFGVGVTIHEMFRLGMVWRSISADTFNDADSLDAGFLIRPASWLSVGMTVRDINTPTLGGVVFPRVYGIGLGFRPGTDRVTMEAGVEVREDSGDVDFLARLRFEPVEGLEIQANVGIQPRGDDLLLDVGMSLALHFGHGGIEGGAFLRNAPGQKLFNGFTVGARVSGASYPKLYERQGRTVTIELGSVGETPRPGLFSEGSSFARQVVYLDAVGRDDVVEAIVIRDRGTGYGWAQTEEIRGLIDDIKARGKDVTVFLDQGDLRHMYMYASAHRIVLNPAGGLRLTGLSSTLTYYRDVLDKIQVDTQWVRFGKYKSAPESFFRVDPSDASREVRNSLLDGLYGHLTGGIAEGLGITKEAVQTIIDEGPYVANECKERGLVHHIAYWDEIQKTVEAARGQPIRFGSPSFARRQAREPWAQPPTVAVIPIEGSIVDGSSNVVPLLGSRNVGSRTIVAAVEAAVRDPKVIGLLIRVNSPGGSATASDAMYRALYKASERKPVVVSFGNVAASGGYYLAMGAKEIISADSTITGSIGIFTGKPSFRRLFKLLGIGRHIFTRGKRADLFSTDRRWTDEETAVITQKVKAFYDMFLQRVSEGRDMKVAAVHEVAQGRVWLGSQARERKLVDSRGGFTTALRRVKERAGLTADDRVRLVFFPKASLVQRVKNALGIQFSALLDRFGHLQDAIALAYPFLNGYQSGEPLALMPWVMTFEF